MSEEFKNEVIYQVKKIKLKLKLLYGLVIMSLFGTGMNILLFILLLSKF